MKIDLQFQKLRYFNNIVLKIDKFYNLNVNLIHQQNAKTRLQ